MLAKRRDKGSDSQPDSPRGVKGTGRARRSIVVGGVERRGSSKGDGAEADLSAELNPNPIPNPNPSPSPNPNPNQADLSAELKRRRERRWR